MDQVVQKIRIIKCWNPTQAQGETRENQVARGVQQTQVLDPHIPATE